MSGQKRVRFGKYSLRMPGTKRQRTWLGGILIFGGALGFLPVLGFWMMPLGLLILSIDYHSARRFRRRAEVWWGRVRRNGKPRRRPADSTARRTGAT